MDTLKDSVVITIVTLDKIQWQCAILVTKEVNPDDPIYIQNSRNAFMKLRQVTVLNLFQQSGSFHYILVTQFHKWLVKLEL